MKNIKNEKPVYTVKIDPVDDTIINIYRFGTVLASFLTDDITEKEVRKVCNELNDLERETSELSGERYRLSQENKRIIEKKYQCPLCGHVNNLKGFKEWKVQD